MIDADFAADAGIYLEPTDLLRRFRGIGGHEHVFARRLDRLAIGDRGIAEFEVEIGELSYGFDLGGILGMDFLRATNTTIDLGSLTIEFA